jgi:hypothetical protein
MGSCGIGVLRERLEGMTAFMPALAISARTSLVS